jgi:hypothetical protein
MRKTKLKKKKMAIFRRNFVEKVPPSILNWVNPPLVFAKKKSTTVRPKYVPQSYGLRIAPEGKRLDESSYYPCFSSSRKDKSTKICSKIGTIIHAIQGSR